MPEKRLISFVLLRASPRRFTEHELRDRFSRALGKPFGDHPSLEYALTEMKPGIFGMRVGRHGYGFMSIDRPYIKQLPPNIDQYDSRVRLALKNHVAWMAIDFMERGQTPTAEDEREAYQVIGPLLASLADHDPDVLAVYSPRHGRSMYWHEKSIERLRSGDPLSVLQPYTPSVVHVPGDDPELIAATEEAKRRWPEFLEAFARKRPGQGFAVKAPFTEDDKTEFMWMEFESIDGQVLRGRLQNQPNDLARLKLGDAVSIQLNDMMDWLYEGAHGLIGAFATKVLQQRGRTK